MKKFLLTLAVAAMSAQFVSAQHTLVESKTTDNWYIGIEAGVSSKTTQSAVFKNLNPTAGLRIGRYFTPVFGFAVEGQVYFRDKQFNEFRDHKTVVRALNTNLLATVNLSSWFGGYNGKPRVCEVVAVAGPGWNHVFGQSEGAYKNDLTAKAGLDVNFNLGASRAWQLFVEPAILYNLTSYDRTAFNVNNSALQLLVGLNYKFGNSNGTHNFAIAQLRDQNEIDQLNARINELRDANTNKDRQISDDAKTIDQLKADLEAAKNVKPVQQVVKQVVNNNVLQPTVIFGLGKSNVDAAQMASVAMIAKYMKNHPNSRLEIKGYASPEGKPELNQKLSEKRAQSVKDVLVKRYGVAADRLVVKGMGATDELFDEIDFNRVATFTDLTK
jgi:outer membrane protein OmpA-like peptidoglycan-associated protein